jgi:AcrR family transcriptional regulator
MHSATSPPHQASRSRPQQRRSRDKLGRILTATAELLEEYSYDELGTRLIAERAGISVGSVYRFFPDKDSIVRELLLSWLDDFTGVLDRASSGEIPARPGVLIDQMVDAYAEFFRREPGFRNAFYSAKRSRELEQAQRKNDHDLAARLYDLLRAGYGPPDPDLETRCLIAVQVGDYLLGLAFRDTAGGDRAVLNETKRLLRLYLGL